MNNDNLKFAQRDKIVGLVTPRLHALHCIAKQCAALHCNVERQRIRRKKPPPEPGLEELRKKKKIRLLIKASLNKSLSPSDSALSLLLLVSFQEESLMKIF